mgnify:CR=1 FL=1
MAVSKKGQRRIVVDNISYHWKFTGKVFVSLDENTNALLIIDFGWYDWIDYLGNVPNKPPDFEPQIATPKFVAASIKFAVNNGWDQGKLEIEYKNRIYRVKK